MIGMSSAASTPSSLPTGKSQRTDGGGILPATLSPTLSQRVRPASEHIALRRSLHVKRQVVFLHLAAHVVKRIIHRVGELQHFELSLAYCSAADHVTPIHHSVPVFSPVNQ